MALANYISQNRICRVLYDLSNPVRPTLTILETLDAIPTGTSGLHLGALYDVSAPVSTPAGKVLGTTATGSWGPIDPPAAVDAIPAVDTPVVTFGTLSSSAAPTITSSGWHREKRVGSSEVVEATPVSRSADLDIAGTTFFRYISLPNAQGTTANPGHYVSSPYLPGSSSSVQNQRWKMGIEFTTTSRYVQFRLRAPSASPSFGLLYVNGRLVQDTFITATGISAGAGYYALLTFPDSRERTIRLLNVNGQEGQFGGVAVDTGATCKAPLSPVGKRVAVIGDSYSVSAGGVSLVKNWVLDVAKHLGADEVVNAGIGGTGWVVQLSTGTASRFDARYSLVSAFAPDIVLFCGGRNDAPGIQSAVEAGVRAFPNSVVAVVSTASNGTQATVTAEIAAACAATGAIPVMLNVDGYEKGGDAIHLTEAGHRLFARDIAELLDKGMSRIGTLNRPANQKSVVSPLAPVTPYMQGVVPATNLTQTANLGKWIAARKTATESLVRIACLGNSNTFATSGASGEADGSTWAWPFRVAAATGLPVAGRVDVCNGHSVLSAHASFPSGNPYKRPYINATGSWDWRTYSGIGMAGYMQCLQGGTGQLTYTSVEECEQFIVGYRDNNVVFTYQVDDGPLVTVTCANSDNTLELLIPAGVKGIHTLKINAPVSGTEEVGIPYIGASLLKGVVVANFGVPGSTSADWYGDAALPNGSMGNSVKPFQPHLVIHQAPSGADEGKATPITPAEAQGFVTNVISYVRANCPNADYIYMQRWDYGDDATSTQYGDAIISNCTTNNVPLFRQDQVLAADASKWLTPTNNHLIRTAHMRIGDSVGTAIMSDWLWQPQLGGSTGGGLTPEQVLAGTNVTVDRATTPGSVIISSTGGGGGALTGLSDVTVTSPQTLAPFVYGGSSVWRNYAPGDQLNVSHIKAPSAYSLRLMSQDGSVRVRVANTGVTFFTDTVIDGGGTGVIGITNASVVPTAAPTNASILYVEGGVLKIRNASATASPVATNSYVDSRTPQTIVLGPTDPVPGGTPSGTVIVRREV
jgi:hypothetical protein